jgi:signal transduction histidine kinase
MMTLWQLLQDLLIEPPGNLIYHLALVFSISATLQITWISRQNSRTAMNTRLLIGFFILLAGQIILFISSSLLWQGYGNAHNTLPPLDRAITNLALIWLVWLMVFPQKNKITDGTAIILSIIVIIALFLTLASWKMVTISFPFNNSFYDFLWNIFSIAILLAGLFSLFIQRPNDWAIVLGVMLILLSGYSIHLIWTPQTGDFSGLVRFAQLCAYPILPSLVGRVFQTTTKSEKEHQEPDEVPLTIPETVPAEHLEKAINTWSRIVAATSTQEIMFLITKAIAETVNSDLCYLVFPTSDKAQTLQFACGYDFIQNQKLPEKSFSKHSIPEFFQTILSGRSLIVNEGENHTEIFRKLNFEQPVTLLMIPLIANQKVLGAVLLLSPYSHRKWLEEDQKKLMPSIDSIAQLLHQISAEDKHAVNERLEITQKKLEKLEQEYAMLHQKLEALQMDSKANIEIMQTIDSESMSKPEILTREQVQSTENFEILNKKYAETLENLKALQIQLDKSQSRIYELEAQLESAMQGDPLQDAFFDIEKKLTATLAKEMRQPMAAIVGYTDLLMSESSGILGSAQLRFLERIKSSTQRMETTLDSFIKASIENEEMPMMFKEPVDLGRIIDDAVADSIDLLRNKNINFKLHIPEKLPEFKTEEDALQQVLYHLIQNASSITPVNGTIQLSITSESQEDQQFILIRVTDSGGGIDPKDIQKVFSRQYREQNPAIKGVGDTGVGLAIAKALAESQGGRIWVESIEGESATFSVLIPTHSIL